MAIREYVCNKCTHEWYEVIRKPEDEPTICRECESSEIKRLISMIGGYSGDLGSGSTRPKNAGSFKKK